MTLDEIKQLIQLVKDSGVAELEVRRGENAVRIRSSASVTDVVIPAPAVQAGAPSHVQPVASAAQAASALPQPAAAEPQTEAGVTAVKSPIVGTYYDSPSPGAPPFVKVGDTVHAGQVLCIIESMKLMNEIEAETSGVIVSKLVENGRAVEYGETLFTVRAR